VKIACVTKYTVMLNTLLFRPIHSSCRNLAKELVKCNLACRKCENVCIMGALRSTEAKTDFLRTVAGRSML